MTRLFTFVTPLLRAFGGGANFLADAADKNPKTNATLTSFIALVAGSFGISPETMTSIGSVLVNLGNMLGG